jgi:branched-chain amino acid transport system ATP-binding protein
MSLLVLENVKKRFDGFDVLTGISLEVRAGERHAIIGPNGAGKSTLFNLISGRLKPTSGRILLRGSNIAGQAPHRIARLGVGRSFQIINVFPKLTVFENVRGAVMSHRGRRFDFYSDVEHLEDVTKATDALISKIGLDHCRDTRAHELAYGEQRKLEIVLTVAMGSELILLDEPCAGLNAEDTHAAIDMIRRITEGHTLVVVEHDMNVVFGLADRVSVIYYGKVLATGTPAEIRANEKVQQAYLGRKASVAQS